jgi:hypothetical protein
MGSTIGADSRSGGGGETGSVVAAVSSAAGAPGSRVRFSSAPANALRAPSSESRSGESSAGSDGTSGAGPSSINSSAGSRAGSAGASAAPRSLSSRSSAASTRSRYTLTGSGSALSRLAGDSVGSSGTGRGVARASSRAMFLTGRRRGSKPAGNPRPGSDSASWPPSAPTMPTGAVGAAACPSNSRTRLITSCGSNGFTNTASQPAFVARSPSTGSKDDRRH